MTIDQTAEYPTVELTAETIEGWPVPREPIPTCGEWEQDRPKAGMTDGLKLGILAVITFPIALILAIPTAMVSLGVWIYIMGALESARVNGESGPPIARGKTYHQMFYPNDPSKWPTPQG